MHIVKVIIERKDLAPVIEQCIGGLDKREESQ